MASSFIEKARSGKVTQPSHFRKFQATAWTAAFEAATDRDEAAKRLHDAGLWVHSRLTRVAEVAASLRFGDQSTEVLTHACCAYVNREIAIIRNMFVAQVQEAGGMVIAESFVQQTITSLTGAEAKPAEFIEALIDGLKFALDELASRKESAPPEQLHLLRIAALVNVGFMFGTYVNIWNDCLWNQVWIHQGPDNDEVTPAKWDRECVLAAARARLDRLVLENSFNATEVWQSLSPQQRHAAAARVRVCVGVEGSGKARRFLFAAAKADRPTPRIFARTVADGIAYSGLLDVPLPRLQTLTLARMVDAHAVLVSVAETLRGRFPAITTVVELKHSLAYAPTLRHDELLKIFAAGMAATRAEAEFLIRMFVRSVDDRKSDIWHRPLVELRPRIYVPVVEALEAPNLVRSIEFWTRESGIDLSLRGPDFEEHARDMVGEGIRRSAIRHVAQILPSSLKFGTPEEELDMVLWIGRTVLVGELKCLLLPAAPKEEHDYLGTVEEAARQAARKAASVERSRSEFLRACREQVAGIGADDFKVVPFVLVSSGLALGQMIDGIPVVDLRVLAFYFHPGDFRRAVTLVAGRPAEGGTTLPFYSDAASAEANISRYLSNPPHIEAERAVTRRALRAIPHLSTGDRPAAWVFPQIDFESVLSGKS